MSFYMLEVSYELNHPRILYTAEALNRRGLHRYRQRQTGLVGQWADWHTPSGPAFPPPRVIYSQSSEFCLAHILLTFIERNYLLTIGQYENTNLLTDKQNFAKELTLSNNNHWGTDNIFLRISMWGFFSHLKNVDVIWISHIVNYRFLVLYRCLLEHLWLIIPFWGNQF